MLPSWSLHLRETHGVTMVRVLSTQNICHFLEFEETQPFSFNVNFKSHISLHAWWRPFLLICLVLLSSWNSGHLLLYLLQQTAPELVFILICLHTFNTCGFLARHTLSLECSSQSTGFSKMKSGTLSCMDLLNYLQVTVNSTAIDFII